MLPSTTALLAASLTLFSSALAFSPDQCDLSDYGAPNPTACTSLLNSIAKLGVGNTSYLFIPASYPTPEGESNGTRKDFPESWETTGCKAALVPIGITNTTVTYDTSSYPDLAAAGEVVVQQCISKTTGDNKGAGGWELAGDEQDLVLHVYAAGSVIDSTILEQNSAQIAATSEDQIDLAEEDDPVYNGTDSSAYSNGTYPALNGTDAGLNDTDSGIFDDGDDSDDISAADDIAGNSTTGSSGTTTSAAPAPAVTTAAAAIVQKAGTFSYVGCEADSATSRTLSSLSWAGTELSVERCATYCAAYQYMGVEFGSECYCGGDANGKGVKSATMVTTKTNSCTTPCNGNATQLCGGAGWLNLYQNGNSATAGGATS